MTMYGTMPLPVTTGGESTLARYLQQVNALPYLTPDQEFSLAKDWTENGNLSAAHQLITSHLRLVVKIAHGFRGYGLPLLELISEGNIGLMQAVKKFDPTKGFRLSTYAMWWIKASIQEYVLHSWSLVKIGTTSAQKKLFFSLRKLKNRLNKVDNSQLTDGEITYIANELHVEKQDVIDMDSRLGQADMSLNTPFIRDDGNSDEMIDHIASKETPYDVVMANNSDMEYKRSLFANALKTLSKREKDIISKRRLSEYCYTLDDLSKEYGISRERIRQIENKAMQKLQAFIADAVAA